MRNNNLKKYLNVFWIRPETALWRACDAEILSRIKFKQPSLDMGCGDGIFSFIFSGGEFSLDFDAYKSAKTNKKEFKNKKDIYDVYTKELKPKIKKNPKNKFSVGFDLKHNLLRKSKDLNLYDNLVQGTGDHLPFKDKTFNSIFSNVVYWIQDLDQVLSELNRILKKNGRLVITVPNNTFKDYLFCYHNYKKHERKCNKRRAKFFKNLDRGRHNTYYNCLSFNEWEKYFKKNNFKIVKSHNYLSKRLINFWDIGFRPFSPFLIRFSNFLEKIYLKKPFKYLYIQLMAILLSPYYKLTTKNDKKYPPAFFIFVLKKEKKI